MEGIYGSIVYAMNTKQLMGVREPLNMVNNYCVRITIVPMKANRQHKKQAKSKLPNERLKIN